MKADERDQLHAVTTVGLNFVSLKGCNELAAVKAGAGTVAPGETEEEYDKAASSWNEYGKAADNPEEKLVDTLIRNDWMHKRAHPWHLAAEAPEAGENGLGPMHWTRRSGTRCK